MARSPLPPHLRSGAFRARDGESAGVTAKRLRGGDLDSTIWGVRRADAADEAERDNTALRRRCELFAARLPPEAFFSHSTAARLWGIPVPPYLARDSRIHISLPAPARAPHATGLRGHSLSVLSDNLLTVDRLTLTDAARTWFDLASQVDLTDLVAAGDHIIHWRTPLLGYEELIQAVAGFSGLRGKRRLKAAGVLLNDRAESPPESTLRVIIVLGGLPEPQANTSYVVGGREVRLDLSFPQFKVALEYQGDYHRTMQGQWRRDMTRRARLEAGGWIVIEVNADDLRNSAELLARLSQVLVSRGWRA